MVQSPDDIDPEDYDSIAEYLQDAFAEGFTIEAEDFEGRECDYCGDVIPFDGWPENVVMWDIPVQEPDDDEPDDYYARYYFCSEECKREFQRDADASADPDMIHEDELEGRT